jgi:ClpP class serine protease
MLAIDPRAFFELFFVPQSRAVERVGTVDVIEISGPLVQRDEMWCDSYDAIRARFKESIAGDARAIVLRFDSPGGDASGCFETARALRADALAANKPLYAYIDKACSAAYALATAATHGIAIGETCCSGSVGVMASRPDYTAQNAMQGLRVAFVSSGSRKLDGNPDYAVSEAELAETKKHVDDLAGKFFALIGDMRPQLPAATVAGFDGGVFYGEGAVEVGLADGVATFDELLASASGGNAMTLQAKSDYDSARASLEKVAKGSDANASAAKRALAAMEEVEPKKDEEEKKDNEIADDEGDESQLDGETSAEDSDDDEPAADGGTPAASSDDAPDHHKKKSETGAGAAPAAQASGSDIELSLAAKVHRLEAQAAAEKEARLRRRLLARRPDFEPEVKAVLSKVSIKALREAVETWPKKTVKRTPPITTVGATRSEDQVDTQAGRTARAGAESAAEMDRRMGFTTQKLGCRRDGSTLYFGVMSADEDKPEVGKSA